MRPQHAPVAPGHRRRPRPHGAGLVLVLLMVTVVGSASHGAPAARATMAPAADLFDDIYRRSQPIDATVKTIHATFTETTTSPMLAKPLVAEGTLHAVRPSDVELIYTTPVAKTITIKGGQLLFVLPDRNLRQERDISAAQGRIQKYFVAKSPSELRRHFTITASEDPTRPGTYLIDMTPKRKQIEQGLTRLELWLRKDTLMLDAMRMYFPGEATKMMEFRDVTVNKGG